MDYQIPDKFVRLSNLSEDQQCFIKNVIDAVTPETESHTFVSVVSPVSQPKDPASQTVLYSYMMPFHSDCPFQVKLAGSESRRINEFSWYLRTLVFIREPDDEFAFKVYSPILGPNMCMVQPEDNAKITFNIQEKNTPVSKFRLAKPSLGDRLSYDWLVLGDDQEYFVFYNLPTSNTHFGACYSHPFQFTQPSLSWEHFPNYKPKGFLPLSYFPTPSTERVESQLQLMNIPPSQQIFIHSTKMQVFTTQGTLAAVDVDENTGEMLTTVSEPGEETPHFHGVFVFVRLLDGSDLVFKLGNDNSFTYMQLGQCGDSVVFKKLKEYKDGNAARIKYDVLPYDDKIVHAIKEQTSGLYLRLDGDTIKCGRKGSLFAFQHWMNESVDGDEPTTAEANTGDQLSQPPTIEGFQKFDDPAIPSEWKQFIETNVPAVKDHTNDTYLAKATVAALEKSEEVNNPIFATAGLQIAEMKNVSSIEDPKGRSLIELSSWYQKTFVFIYDNKKKSFETYSPMLCSNLYMVEDDKQVKFKSSGTALLSTFSETKDYPGTKTAYIWKIGKRSSLAVFGTNMQLTYGIGSSIVFDQPFKTSVKVGTPEGFALLTDLNEDIQELVNTNIPSYASGVYRMFVAHVDFSKMKIFRLYIDLFLLKATLEATPLSDSFSKLSWNQYYFVFVEKEKDTFEVFTPIAKHDLGLAINQVQGESFIPDPLSGWTQFEFVSTASEGYWLWRLKGKGLYLNWDPIARDIDLTDDPTTATNFTFSSELILASPCQ